MNNSTIAAIATPNAPGGIGIVRISGENALDVAAKIFKTVSGKSVAESKGYCAHFGNVYDNNERLDEAVCLVFRAPRSYTGEDVAEISCHGGLYVTKRVLRASLDAGAVPAEAGEFTKRAFLNGKLDLAAAESVMALIGASGKQAAAAALNTLEGSLSREIKEVAQSIVSVCASLAAWVDYPDEDIEDTSAQDMLPVFENAKKELSDIIRRYDCGRAVTDGIDAVIVGKPNVGKSTLMNMLTGFERSIVTDIAGTTRDVVEEKIVLGEIIMRVADTAGIRETENVVENIGVNLARRRLERAELVLAVFDGSEPLTDDDLDIINQSKGKKAVALLNKADLPLSADRQVIADSFEYVVELSASTGEGRDELERAVAKICSTDEFNPNAACLTSERQRQCCVNALSSIEDALAAIHGGMTLDAVNVCADCAIDALLELTGEKATSAVVDEVFSRFCVGK
ncbi:MAG: tRNA uridine-5-carboxymethylaminomethyl(34) synthesis GTPase MnmE [Acutalibacteraceae bacterium]|nr:tRNA uridine-5-carboxymethylaminomethyl(34) synthesis GTPase MnmE [Acutalibacteraceae bacterium]